MLRVIEIVQKLSEAHAKAVRKLLAADESYAALTLQIFDAYRKGGSEKETQKQSELDEKSFKIIERVLYRCILAYYKIEDISVKDIIQTTLFYSIYGTTPKSDRQKTEEFEQLFHQLKRYHLDQQAAPILKELKNLYQGSPLEAVYTHLYERYQSIENTNNKAIEAFEQFNSLLEVYLNQSNNHHLKELILAYKNIRRIARSNENPTATSLYFSSKLSLAVLANQEQILRDGNWKLESLFNECKNQINALPFGVMRFYLKNIHSHVEMAHLFESGKLSEAKAIYKDSSFKALFEAYNFNFPNQFLADHSLFIETKTIKMPKLMEIQPIRKNNSRLNSALEQIILNNYIGRDRLSRFLN